jgi:uracil-DNA glycosylase family 4
VKELKKVGDVKGCEGCPLRNLNPQATFVEPLIGAGLEVAIGNAPNKESAGTGVPMSGGCGNTLKAMFRKAGIQKDDVTLLNVIQCRPPHDIFPTEKKAGSYIAPGEGQKAVAHCLKAHVLPLLRSRPWTRVILLGDQPTAWIAAKWASADKWRGSVLPIPAIDPDRPLGIVTLSPEQVQERQKFFPVVVNDLRKPMFWSPESYTLYPSVADVRAFTAKRFAFDIETSYEPDAEGKREIYVVALCDRLGNGLVVPFTDAYIPELQRIFADAVAVVGHNVLQFDLPQLRYRQIGINASCQVWDTMLMQHLRFPDLPHDLEFVYSQFGTKPAWKHEKAVKELYAAKDVDATWAIFEPLVRLLQESGMMDLYWNIQVPLARICRLMTETGIKIDPSRLTEVQKRIEKEIEELELQLPEHLRSYYVTVNKMDKAPEGYRDPVTGKPRKRIKREAQEKVVPWRKDRFKKNLLYVEWSLPPQLSPKTGKLTADKTALDKLHRRLLSPSSEFHNPERATVLKALKNINRKDHFLGSFVKEERKGTERIHPEFNVHGTSSGRLSSSGGEAGNFQNQPEQARYMYVPSEPDWEIAEVDYSNIENRLTALLAGDTYRLKRYDDPKHSDYKLLASRAFDIPYDEVEKDNDREAPYGKAKAIVLGTNYGLGALKTANMYDMDLQETKDLMVTWKKEIAFTVEWQRYVTRLARDQGWLCNAFARKRWFYTEQYYTQALSFLPQSTAADVIYRAMIGLYFDRVGLTREQAEKVVKVAIPLPKPARILLQVHDALVIEYPKSMREEILGIVKKVMEQPWPELNGYSIPVGIAIGPSWGEVESYKFQ